MTMIERNTGYYDDDEVWALLCNIMEVYEPKIKGEMDLACAAYERLAARHPPVPEQILVLLATEDTSGVTIGFTVITVFAEVAVGEVAQATFDVSTA